MANGPGLPLLSLSRWNCTAPISTAIALPASSDILHVANPILALSVIPDSYRIWRTSGRFRPMQYYYRPCVVRASSLASTYLAITGEQIARMHHRHVLLRL